jgi:hypothetical protein
MISGAVSARCVAAACSRCSLVMTSGGGVTLIVSRGGVSSHPAIVAPMEAISSTGSDTKPMEVGPDESRSISRFSLS